MEPRAVSLSSQRARGEMSETLGQLAWERKWEALNDELRAGRDPNAKKERVPSG